MDVLALTKNPNPGLQAGIPALQHHQPKVPSPILFTFAG
jgi:hypothetical protein